jgi:hypothetical protein
MSPERLTSAGYSYTADIWSLGMSLITLATGKFPIDTSSGYWGIVIQLTEKPSPTLPSDSEANFSQEMRDFLAKCLIKEPEKRWQAEQLLEHEWMKKSPENQEFLLSQWPKAMNMYNSNTDILNSGSKHSRKDSINQKSANSTAEGSSFDPIQAQLSEKADAAEPKAKNATNRRNILEKYGSNKPKTSNKLEISTNSGEIDSAPSTTNLDILAKSLSELNITSPLNIPGVILSTRNSSEAIKEMESENKAQHSREITPTHQSSSNFQQKKQRLALKHALSSLANTRNEIQETVLQSSHDLQSQANVHNISTSNNDNDREATGAAAEHAPAIVILDEETSSSSVPLSINTRFATNQHNNQTQLPNNCNCNNLSDSNAISPSSNPRSALKQQRQLSAALNLPSKSVTFAPEIMTNKLNGVTSSNSNKNRKFADFSVLRTICVFLALFLAISCYYYADRCYSKRSEICNSISLDNLIGWLLDWSVVR